MYNSKRSNQIQDKEAKINTPNPANLEEVVTLKDITVTGCKLKEGIQVQLQAHRYETTPRFYIYICFENESMDIEIEQFELDTLLCLEDIGGSKLMIPFGCILANGPNTDDLINFTMTSLLADAEVEIHSHRDGIQVVVCTEDYEGSVVINNPILDDVIEF